MQVPVGDTLYLAFFTHSSAGASADADSTPTVNWRENGGAASTTGVTVVNVTTGEYEAEIVCSTGNGFDEGKWYEVAAIAVVGGVTSKQNICRFRVVQVEAQPGVPKADVYYWRGGAVPSVTQSGVPEVDVTYWVGGLVGAPTNTGVPNVNAKTWNDLTTVELPLVPTTAGRKLDVSAGGEAGLDWANIGSPTTVQGLSGTTIKTATDVETDTQDIQARLPAALGANGNIKADVRDWLGVAAAAVTTGGVPEVDVTYWRGGLVPAPTVTGEPRVDVRGWLGTAPSTPTVAGVPNVNTKTWNDLTTVALPLIPTVAGRTLDVSAGGEGGLDWANIGSPTTVVGLSGTTVKTATDVETDTQDIQSRLPAALSGGNMKTDVLAISGDTTAADNLELQFDGTGYVHATAPATQAALDAVDNFVDTEVGTIVTGVADIQTRLPAALTAGGNMKSDALAISGDTTAADNLELQFDGTGYVHATAPATQTALATVDTVVDSILVDTTRLRGLLHENSRDDNHIYDGDGNLTSCRKRAFADAASCTASTVGALNNADGEVARYTLTFTYVAQKLTSFKWVRDL